MCAKLQCRVAAWLQQILLNLTGGFAAVEAGPLVLAA